ncbi:citrate lyase holo-[acyl-carrier protein] synthase [Orbus mooreae]|uniref:citrate lyase holo-[acyl-carrier protein] synthase n=1 Tax=Orbus mooreae TaxID=3074107 RepID=UPI00370D7088
MKLSFEDGVTITLEQMLVAKERRVQRQLQYLAQYQLPIISLTLVIPGAIKASSGTKYLFAEAMAMVERYFEQYNIQQVALYQDHAITGDEAIIVYNCEVVELKQHCITIEESHPLGRLWDIDVLDPTTQMSLSRNTFLHKPRQCLVCQNLAKVCGRSRQHSTDQIMQAIKHKVNIYQASLSN